MAENSDIKNTASFIRKKLQLRKARTAIILGSGLSGFATELENVSVLAYKDIPVFRKVRFRGIKASLSEGFCMAGSLSA